jgi:hypothetical protein
MIDENNINRMANKLRESRKKLVTFLFYLEEGSLHIKDIEKSYTYFKNLSISLCKHGNVFEEINHFTPHFKIQWHLFTNKIFKIEVSLKTMLRKQQNLQKNKFG